MTLPNFLIIGAQKAGTTALYKYLNQHPEIYMSPDKEPKYFAFKGDKNIIFPYRTLDQYEALFRKVTDEKAIGEASTIYLESNIAAERIAQTIPLAKMIAILRNPLERAYSAYIFRTREGRETRNDFSKVLQDEIDIIRNNQHKTLYLTRGFYAQQIERFYAQFPTEQIKLFLFEDFVNDISGVLVEIYRFLGVDVTFSANTKQKYNVSAIPRNPLAKAALSWLGRQHSLKMKLRNILPQPIYWSMVAPAGKALNEKLRTARQIKPPPMDIQSQDILRELYREDIEKLHHITGLPVMHWLEI